VRVGVIGTENSHVDHIVDLLNVRQGRGDTRVVALAGGDNERNRALAEKGSIDTIVDGVEELLPLADALIITDRHGGLHREHALPFLEDGRPVLVDKPLAASVADAEAIIAAAQKSGSVMTSYSAVRWAQGVNEIAEKAPSLGELQAVITSGPADSESEYGGIFFYGIHAVDVALRLAPGPIGDVHVERLPDSVVAGARVGDAYVTVNFVKPTDGGRVPFHAMVVGRTGIEADAMVMGDHYLDTGLNVFFDAVDAGKSPLDYADILRPIQFLEAVQNGLQ